MRSECDIAEAGYRIRPCIATLATGASNSAGDAFAMSARRSRTIAISSVPVGPYAAPVVSFSARRIRAGSQVTVALLTVLSVADFVSLLCLAKYICLRYAREQGNRLHATEFDVAELSSTMSLTFWLAWKVTTHLAGI